MNRILILVVVGGVTLIIGFFSGRAFQHAKTGYHIVALEQKEYASALGPIQWKCFFESEGIPIHETEKTTISMGNRTIYKAQRDFQEDAPYARNITTSSNSIAWEDGDYKYHLVVEPMPKSQQPRR
ncbi:MAG: hypothetical protein JWO95_1609 [Verrucomicrobiales bacterium]|nr:hypothetical protein [Verrucomicrobiales bacterium]